MNISVTIFGTGSGADWRPCAWESAAEYAADGTARSFRRGAPACWIGRVRKPQIVAHHHIIHINNFLFLDAFLMAEAWNWR